MRIPTFGDRRFELSIVKTITGESDRIMRDCLARCWSDFGEKGAGGKYRFSALEIIALKIFADLVSDWRIKPMTAEKITRRLLDRVKIFGTNLRNQTGPEFFVSDSYDKPEEYKYRTRVEVAEIIQSNPVGIWVTIPIDGYCVEVIKGLSKIAPEMRYFLGESISEETKYGVKKFKYL